MAAGWSKASDFLSSILDEGDAAGGKSSIKTQCRSIRMPSRVTDQIILFLFRFSLFRMTKNDVKQYLEKIYKIDVLDVTTTIKQGSRSPFNWLMLFLSREGKSSSGLLGNHRSWSWSKIRLRLPGKYTNISFQYDSSGIPFRKTKRSNIRISGVVECRSTNWRETKNGWMMRPLHSKLRRFIDPDSPVGFVDDPPSGYLYNKSFRFLSLELISFISNDNSGMDILRCFVFIDQVVSFSFWQLHQLSRQCPEKSLEVDEAWRHFFCVV